MGDPRNDKLREEFIEAVKATHDIVTKHLEEDESQSSSNSEASGGFQIYGWGIGGSKSSQKENYNRSYKHFEGEMHNMKPFTLFEINSQQIQVANNARIQDLIGKSKIYSLTGSLEPYIDILAYQQQQEIMKCLNDVN